jgi:hypothetical protein
MIKSITHMPNHLFTTQIHQKKTNLLCFEASLDGLQPFRLQFDVTGVEKLVDMLDVFRH